MELVKADGILKWLSISNLYKRAFPINERKPLSKIRKMQKLGKTDVWCFVHNGRFAGFASTVNSEDKIMIDYLAVSSEKRGKGIGTEAMKHLISEYAGKGVFVEIEKADGNYPDIETRKRRKHFYISCGLKEMHTSAKVFGVDMELLGYDCFLDFEGYREFYRKNISEYASCNIKPI